jgi:hypothetical protein
MPVSCSFLSILLAKHHVTFIELYSEDIKTLWPYSVNELCRPSDRGLLAKLVTTFTDRGCLVVRATDPCCRIQGSCAFETFLSDTETLLHFLWL